MTDSKQAAPIRGEHDRHPGADGARGQDDGHTLEHVIDGIARLGEEQDRVTVADMQHEVGERSYGPFLFVPAVLEISPVGGIPGVPTVLAVTVSIFALQMLFGRRSFWIPQLLARRSVDGDKLRKAMEKMRKPVRFMDRIVRPRLKRLTRKPFVQIAAALVVVAACTVPPLEVLPFASSIPFGAICLLGLGFTARDGLLVGAGMAGAIAAVGAVGFVLLR